MYSDINIPIYKGGFEITFTRNNYNNALFCWKSKKKKQMALKMIQP